MSSKSYLNNTDDVNYLIHVLIMHEFVIHVLVLSYFILRKIILKFPNKLYTCISYEDFQLSTKNHI